MLVLLQVEEEAEDSALAGDLCCSMSNMPLLKEH